MPNRSDARQSIYQILHTAWQASSHTRDEKLVWVNVSADVPIEPNQFNDTSVPSLWADVSVQHVSSEISSLRGTNGLKRYRRAGFVRVNVYTPTGDGLEFNDIVVGVVSDGLEGKTTANGVELRSASSQEVGNSGPWFQSVVTVEFEYDEVK